MSATRRAITQNKIMVRRLARVTKRKHDPSKRSMKRSLKRSAIGMITETITETTYAAPNQGCKSSHTNGIGSGSRFGGLTKYTTPAACGCPDHFAADQRGNAVGRDRQGYSGAAAST